MLLLGFGAEALPLDYETRAALPAFHMSVGLTAAAVALLYSLFALVSAAGPRGPRQPVRTAGRIAVTLSLLTLAASGAFRAAAEGAPVALFGFPLTEVVPPDSAHAGLYAVVHTGAAYVLAGGLAALALRAVGAALAPTPGPQPAAEPAAPLVGAALFAQPLVKRLGVAGWATFWVQFVLAFFSAPLLAFGMVGRSISPDVQGVWHAIHWGVAGLGLLIIALLLALYYPRASRNIARDPGFTSARGVPPASASSAPGRSSICSGRWCPSWASG